MTAGAALGKALGGLVGPAGKPLGPVEVAAAAAAETARLFASKLNQVVRVGHITTVASYDINSTSKYFLPQEIMDIKKWRGGGGTPKYKTQII